MYNFELIAPSTRAEVLALLGESDDDTRLLAGGTGLLNLIKQRLVYPERLISLHGVTDLGDIALANGVLNIGATARLSDVARNLAVQENFPMLAATLHEVASPRIRDMATFGGAVAHADPNQDLPVTLMALDAMVFVESNAHSRQIAIADFYTDYYETALKQGEMVTAIQIPVPDPATQFACIKFTPGSREDYACVGVAVSLGPEPRIVLGSVASTVFRAHEAENLIIGETLSDALAHEAAAAAAAMTDPVDDTRGSAAYKRQMAEVWVRRMLMQASSQAGRN